MSEIKVYPDPHMLTEAAVDLIIDLAEESIGERGSFTVALSGGTTPAPVYRALSEPQIQKRMNWKRIHLFLGDERHVPRHHPDSNFRMVKAQLLDSVLIPEENIHSVAAEMEVRMAAFSYEETLRRVFDGEWPRFDLILLGMGGDGHTASLFPHSAGLNEEHRWFIANFAPKQEEWRLTLSKNAINAARNIVVLVSGESKATMLKEVFIGHYEPEDKPIQLISPVDGRMLWLLDSEAASQLPAELRM